MGEIPDIPQVSPPEEVTASPVAETPNVSAPQAAPRKRGRPAAMKKEFANWVPTEYRKPGVLFSSVVIEVNVNERIVTLTCTDQAGVITNRIRGTELKVV